ncbi:MAG: YitT family protein [Proteobacteria bacterium]|nr:YitT family protein [Pseudomonadota bacterium]MBU1386687.1 YitT family protein [Pseudomonadota bacterium]MBU1543298.1 YitT family protein [Pseudomonadota bacterium]MBU2483129.1 YitT family protein [Pseudomonadota bacterium]
MQFKNITYSIPWNLFLITLGSIIFSIGLKAIVIPNGMITGGFSGAGILIYYYSGIFTPGIWYLLLNIPIFILGWIFVSKRFLLYSLYGAVIITIAIDLIQFEIALKDLMLATIAGGAVLGAGAGIVFRSLGSVGGNDIIAIILNQKFGIRIGTYNFCFNLILFLCSFGSLNTELILYSMTMSYITSQVIEYCITMFNQRKTIFIVSDKPKEIAAQILTNLKRGATFIKGEGTYTGRPKDIILTVVNTFQIKRVEEIVFTIDPDAFLITENTFNVLGKGFSQRKVY